MFSSVILLLIRPFYTPNFRAAERQTPEPRELAWEFQQDQTTWRAELLFHGESWGWEAQISRDGDLVIRPTVYHQSARPAMGRPRARPP
jgi:hypothetical protein